jgi:hypothetical protein
MRAFGKNGVALTAIIHLTVFALNLFTCPRRTALFFCCNRAAHKAHAGKVSITIFEIVTRRQRAFLRAFLCFYSVLCGVGEAKSAQNFFQ